MPVTWTIENATLTLLLGNTYELRDLKAAMQAAFSDPFFQEGISLLIDEHNSTENPSADEERAQVRWIASLRPRIGPRVALVTAESPLHYGIARMASVYFEIEGLRAAVFTDMDTAKRWLASSATP